MKKLILTEEVLKIRKMMGLNEAYDEYIDPISAAKSNAKSNTNFNQDAIDYVGGEDVWNGLSQEERDSVLADIEGDWDRSRSMGESANTDLELKSVAKQIFSVLKKYGLSPNYISGDVKLNKANDSSIIIGADKENGSGLITIYIFAWAVRTNKIDVNRLSSDITQTLGNEFENQNSKTSIGNDIVYKMLVRQKMNVSENNAPEDYMPYQEDQTDIDEKIKSYMNHHGITDLTQGIKDYMALCLWKGDEATSDDNQEGEALWSQRYNAAKKKLMSSMDESYGSLEEGMDNVSGVMYDTMAKLELEQIVGNLHKIAPYVLEIGDMVRMRADGAIDIYQDGKMMKMFKTPEAFLSGIKYSKISVEGSGFQGEPNFQLPAEDDLLGEESMDMGLSMAVMSHLSDLQEEAPELRGKINFIKALVMKMDCKTQISTDELDSLRDKYNGV